MAPECGFRADSGLASVALDSKRPGRLLSAQTAATYLGVPYTSLRDWAMRGHIPVVRVPECRRMWFDRRDLDRAVEAWKERLERGAMVSIDRR